MFAGLLRLFLIALLFVWVLVAYVWPTTLDEGSASDAPDGVNGAAATALRNNPLSDTVFVQRAQALNAQVNATASERERVLTLSRTALERNPRNGDAMSLLLSRSVETGDVQTIVEMIDQIARVRPRARDSAIETLVSLSGDPNLLSIVSDRIANDAVWANDYIAALIESEGNGPGFSSVILALAKAKGQTSTSIDFLYDRVITQAITAGRYDQAYEHWLTWRADAGAGRTLVYNETFLPKRETRYFDWITFNRHLAYSDLSGEEGLLLSSAADENVLLAQQFIRLEEGQRYTLNLDIERLARLSERAFRIEIRCISDGPLVLEFDIEAQGFGPDQLKADFTMPAQTCPGQTIRIFSLTDVSPRRTSLMIKRLSIVPAEGNRP